MYGMGVICEAFSRHGVIDADRMRFAILTSHSLLSLLHSLLHSLLNLKFTSPPRPQLLDDASKEFKVGEMLHDEYFSLYDSMAALELMDPKMDDGMITNVCLPIKERFLNGATSLSYLLLSSLLPPYLFSLSLSLSSLLLVLFSLLSMV